MKRSHRISACVITFNEEANIRRCLNSLTWCDEIVILDSFSTDRTIEICKEYTDRVFQSPWEGYILQRNRIRDLATCEWVLFLDADEEVSPLMRDEIDFELSKDDSDYVGFEFPRQVYYLGKWIRHGEWYPDLKLRLFMRERGTSGGVEPHDMVIVDGLTKTLKGQIWHYTYDDLTDHITQTNRFSTISARAKFESGQRFSWMDFLLRPPFRFFKSFILKAGVLDRRRGLIIATVSAFGVFMKYAKLWELQREAHDGASSSGALEEEAG